MKTIYLQSISTAKLAVFTLLFALFACTDSNDSDSQYVCTDCADEPSALAQHDASARGVYKGVVIGSTGTITVNIENGSNLITATLVLDGESILLTSSTTVTEGDIYLAPFTGTYNGLPVSITFQVGASGSNPTVVTSDIPGHPNAVFTVFKETSDSLVEAFEGTYSTSAGETGIFNIILSSGPGIFGGVSKNLQTMEVNNEIEGLYSADGQLTSLSGVLLATINGDVLNGTFQDGNNTTVTVQGNRTL